MNYRQILAVAALTTILAAPAVSEAQYRQNRRYDQRYDRRNDNQVERLVVHAERESNQFRALFERHWDNRRERDWSRDWDRDWSRGRRDRLDVLGRGNGNNRYERGGGDWDSNFRYSRRYSPKDSVQRLDEALERLRHAVTRDRRDRNWNDYRVGRDEMMEVVRAADNVDFYFGRSRGYNSALDREWAQVRRSVDALARFYNVRAYDRW